MASETIGAEAVARRVQVLAAIATSGSVAAPIPDAYAPPRVHVPLPDLSRFDQLLGGRDIHENSHADS